MGGKGLLTKLVFETGDLQQPPLDWNFSPRQSVVANEETDANDKNTSPVTPSQTEADVDWPVVHSTSHSSTKNLISGKMDASFPFQVGLTKVGRHMRPIAWWNITKLVCIWQKQTLQKMFLSFIFNFFSMNKWAVVNGNRSEVGSVRLYLRGLEILSSTFEFRSSAASTHSPDSTTIDPVERPCKSPTWLRQCNTIWSKWSLNSRISRTRDYLAVYALHTTLMNFGIK